ncbi:hypothetical protein [Streptomyces sp. NPDC001880]
MIGALGELRRQSGCPVGHRRSVLGSRKGALLAVLRLPLGCRMVGLPRLE